MDQGLYRIILFAEVDHVLARRMYDRLDGARPESAKDAVRRAPTVSPLNDGAPRGAGGQPSERGSRS
jgi:hypothetical protein